MHPQDVVVKMKIGHVAGELTCSLPHCTEELSARDLRDLFTPSEFTNYQRRALDAAENKSRRLRRRPR